MTTSRHLALALALCCAAGGTARAAEIPGTAAGGSPCMKPQGKDGLPAALSTPTSLGKTKVAPGGAPFVAGPVQVTLTRSFMPAYVGATTGEAVVDAEAVVRGSGEKTSDNSAWSHVPAVLRFGTYRVTIDDVGDTPATSFSIAVDDLGCTSKPTGKPLRKGESLTLWLSTEGANGFELFDGEDDFNAADVVDVNLTSGTSENSRRKVVVDDHMRPLIPGWISLGVYERNDAGNDSKEINAEAMADKRSFSTNRHTVEVLKLVHGPRTVVRFKEPYAPTAPVASVLIRITRR